ncbi:MAG: hypothetical protein JEZ10_07145 [Verrucomicrobia bacterium]|nr:hypothetical protein [Verrucomicrobiota bacterium]
MKSTPKNLLLLFTVLLLAGCFRNDIRTVTFEIQQLRTPEAARLLTQSLHGLSGITEVRPDLENKTFTVVFNGRELYLKNIEYAIVTGGFDLPHWPAESADKAKLPEELR